MFCRKVFRRRANEGSDDNDEGGFDFYIAEKRRCLNNFAGAAAAAPAVNAAGAPAANAGGVPAVAPAANVAAAITGAGGPGAAADNEPADGYDWDNL